MKDGRRFWYCGYVPTVRVCQCGALMMCPSCKPPVYKRSSAWPAPNPFHAAFARAAKIGGE